MEGASSAARRVAIVGSGIAGLVAAHALRARGCEVQVLEQRPRPAIAEHAPTLTVDGAERSFDTLLLWPDYHVELLALARRLGLGARPNPFETTSFFARGSGTPYFWYESAKILGRETLVPGAPRWRRMVGAVGDWARFMGRSARALHATSPSRLGDEIASADAGYRAHIYPWLNASLGFPPAAAIDDCPLAAASTFQRAALFRAPLTLEPGMPVLAARLLDGCRFHPLHEVERLEPIDGGVRVQGTSAGEPFSLDADAVVLATPPRPSSRLAARIVDVRWPTFSEDAVSLVAHTDRTVVPGPAAGDRRTVSYVLPSDPRRGMEMTIEWGRVASMGGREVFFTWNGHDDPRAECVLDRRSLTRVLPSVRVQRFLEDDLPRVQGRGGVYFTGVWARPGRAGYLEDGVVHARGVAALVATHLRMEG
jgi:predicted NAD/FAD-binding protein